MTQQYWLFKTEPTAFSIDDLKKSKNQTAPWDGVRNYQARNFLRDSVKVGDGVLFYHGSCKTPGIAGEAVVVRSGYPDHTAWDPKNIHYDPKSAKDRPIWHMVDVKLARKFKEIITLERLRKTPGLGKMVLLQRGSRLSIQPVETAEWKIIIKIEAGSHSPCHAFLEAP